MKVKVRTVKEGEFEVEINPTETVENLKEKIEAKAGHQKAWQKIIFSGKILDGASTIESCGIKDNDFVVLIAKAPRTAAPATKEEPKPAEQPKPEENKPSTPATQPQTAPSTQTSTTGSGDSAFEEQVKGMMEMGFPREQVIKALRAAFNNSERAVQYLLGGDIPDVAEGAFGEEMMQPGEEMEEEEEEEEFQGQPGTGGPGTFDFLTQHPQFQTLRAMVQANPQLLQVVLAQLGQSNPELLTMINENREEFVRLLQGPLPQGGGVPQPGAQPGQPGEAPPGVQYIQVSPEEKAAIDRLCTLGFPRSKVIEAFFACDKDEQLAANYLLENIGDEMDDQ